MTTLRIGPAITSSEWVEVWNSEAYGHLAKPAPCRVFDRDACVATRCSVRYSISLA
jgi:hypothetical protein